MRALTGVDELSDLPPFSLSAVFTEWGIDPYLFVLTVWVTGLYLFGVWLLRSRGDSWPIGRTISFVVNDGIDASASGTKQVSVTAVTSGSVLTIFLAAVRSSTTTPATSSPFRACWSAAAWWC